MAASDQHLAFSVTKRSSGADWEFWKHKAQSIWTRRWNSIFPCWPTAGGPESVYATLRTWLSGMEGVEDSLEAYTNPDNKHYQIEASLGWQPLTAAMPESVRSYETYDLLQTFKRLRKPGEAQLYTSANTESWPNFWSTSPANRCRRSSASCCGARSARTTMHIFGEPKEFPHRPCRDGDDAARSRTVWFAVHRLGTIGKRASSAARVS